MSSRSARAGVDAGDVIYANAKYLRVVPVESLTAYLTKHGIQNVKAPCHGNQCKEAGRGYFVFSARVARIRIQHWN